MPKLERVLIVLGSLVVANTGYFLMTRSALDEMAAAAGRDPIEYQLDLIGQGSTQDVRAGIVLGRRAVVVDQDIAATR